MIRFKTLALTTCAAIALATAASAQDRAGFDIAGGDLKTALQTFARQTSQEVLFSSDLVAGRSTKGVSAETDPQSALVALLEGTGLTYSKTPTGTLLIVRADGPQSGSAAGDGAEVEALIVTAQKREEDIQDVPIAISAFTQEDLTRSQVAGGPDLITQVPNMTFTKTNFSSYSIQLRGIGTQAISATTDPAVAVAFNNTPFIRNRFFEQEFYDMQRVEVLRGPQGTLYGRNATAGVVNLISQKPKFLAEAKLSGDLSNYNSSRLEGMVNVPLVEDKVALRLAGAWTKREGYATNRLTDQQIDGRDLWSTRLSLRFAPSERFDATFIWEHFQEDDDRLRSGKQLCHKHVVTEVAGMEFGYFDPFAGAQQFVWNGPEATLSQGCERGSLYSADAFQTPNGLMLPYYGPISAIGVPTALTDPYVSTVQSPDLRVIESMIDPHYRASADIGELQFSFDLTDHLSLSSETAYGTDFVYSLQDFNRFNTAPGAWETDVGNDAFSAVNRGVLSEDGVFCDPQLGCSDRLVAVDVSTAESWQFSQELRLASDFDGAFNFSRGANYLRADSEDKYYVFINSLSLAAQNGFVVRDTLPPYDPRTSDNISCMDNGFMPGDPNRAYGVASCVYMDTNPIESVNDEGHNYFLSKNPYKLISYAVFGEAYYQITDTLKITAGLRWTVDKKEAPRVPTWLLVSQSVGYPIAEVIEQEWREPTGRLTADWKPDLAFTDETMIYASYAHGYKAGGANPPGYVRSYYSNPSVAAGNALTSETRPRTFDPEFVDAFELGTKNTLLDGRLTLNLAGFYYDYKDYQISEIVDRSAFNRNFDATVWGLEIEADWRPIENLRLGLKTGYEETRIADGERAIDLMDRTAGMPGWTIVRPFPTYASSCILPEYTFVRNGVLSPVGNVGGGGEGGCENAYILGLDPVTAQPYTLNPFPGYAGFDPTTAPNNGEGFFKELGGNELPNAPNLTATITADYTLPLPNEWLATLHTDLHWQGESDWRVFQDHEYSQLDEYFTMNLAAIFVNEEQGWNVMAYIKNVTDETAITGAFLNSDDTGLTTNVFLTEPRLYGLRVTKAWTGGSTWGSFGQRREGPFPLTVEIGGQVQRQDAPTVALEGGDSDLFTGPLAVFDDVQDADLDWGDGREARVTWRPSSGPWSLSVGARRGGTNGQNHLFGMVETEGACVFDDPDTCAAFASNPATLYLADTHKTNNAKVGAWDREEHDIVDFSVGYDVDIGMLRHASVSIGIVRARLGSQTEATLQGVPDWNIPNGFFFSEVTHHTYDIKVAADRDFEGTGALLSFNGGLPLLDWADAGKLELDGSLSAGALWGDREVTITGGERSMFVAASAIQVLFPDTTALPTPQITPFTSFNEITRSQNVTVPYAAGSVGLGYEIGRVRVGAGYRWERYFDALDVGYDQEQDADRTIDGPYFKLSVGFGD